MIKIGQEIEGRINMNASGSAYLQNTELPKEIYIYKTNTNKALHLDYVKVRVVKGKGRELEGIVTEIIKRVKTEYVGTIKITNSTAFLVPDSNKMPVDIFVPLKKLNGAKDGEKVVVKIKDWNKKSNSPNGEVIKVLGSAGNNDVEIHSILHEYDLPYDFEEDVLAESKTISEEITESEIANRRDMRNVTTFTIDPEDAKDFDDALSVEWVNGNILVGIHIADVSHYVRPESDLDKEAYRRGTSIYLVDRVVPMLPERLSNEICSLKPHEDKLCFSVIFTMDHNANIIDEWFGKTIINSNHRYTYEEAQLVIENDLENYVGSDRCIIELNNLAKKLRKQRLKEGSLTFDKEEIKFKLENGKPVDIIFKTSKDANKLIEEFMLLANKRVAFILKDNEFPFVSRVHEEPSTEKLSALRQFIKQFDYDIKINTPQEITKTLNKLLIDVKGKSEENLISNLVVRTMQKAFYTTKNLGHYGLGFDDYAHFTSPIRRYPDIIVHRLLNRFLTKKPVPKIEKLEQKCIYLSGCEMKAQKAERDSIKYMQSIYMSERIGFIYRGIITSITDYGLFIQIIENNCDGLVRIGDIQGDRYITDLENYCIKGINTGNIIRLGDEILVTVSSVDIERKNINLSIINA
jgi:ribonuclease R